MKYIERSNSCISECNVALQEKKLSNEYEQKARENFNFTSTCFSSVAWVYLFIQYLKKHVLESNNKI